LDPGQLIDEKYQIVRILGEGGMGAVYEARHGGTGRRVAVKVIVGEHQGNEAIVARFQREARAAGSIETQHIAQVLDTGTDRATGHPYMVMEFLSGEDVQQCLKRVGPLEPTTALRIISQACIGLGKAHDAGVVHRDIKPANLYLSTQEDGAVVVKLLDFGIAKVKVEHSMSSEDAKLTQTGSLLGSPMYMSPEQALGGKVTDARTDVWSLGIVLYEVLTGTTPSANCEGFGELIMSICSTPAPPVQDRAPWVSPELARIVHRALEIPVDKRYASIADMHADIRALLLNGHALDHSLLVGVSDATKQQSAKPYVASVEAITNLDLSLARTIDLPAAKADIVVPKEDENVAKVATAAGVSTTTSSAPQPKRSGVAPIAIAAAAIFVVAGIGAVYAKSRGANVTPVADRAQDTPSAVPLVAIVSPAPSSTPSAAPIGTARTVTVTVTPPTASIEVDGAPASATNGVLEIHGTLGSTHHVRVFAGKKETLANVVVSEDGAVPAKVDLDTKLVASGTKPNAGNGAGAGAKTDPAPLGTKPAAVAPAQTPPKQSSSAVDRDFQ
jgi:serine/threonine-protein kinase